MMSVQEVALVTKILGRAAIRQLSSPHNPVLLFMPLIRSRFGGAGPPSSQLSTHSLQECVPIVLVSPQFSRPRGIAVLLLQSKQ